MTIQPWEIELNSHIELLHFANDTFEEYVSYPTVKQMLQAAYAALDEANKMLVAAHEQAQRDNRRIMELRRRLEQQSTIDERLLRSVRTG